MPPKKVGSELSNEEIESAELRTKIKEIYGYLRTKFTKMPPKQKYTSGALKTLKDNLQRLELMKKDMK